MKTGVALVVSGLITVAFFTWYILAQMSNLWWVVVLFIDMVVFSAWLTMRVERGKEAQERDNEPTN